MQLSQTKWADHLRGCAEIANEIAKILDIRDDAARQAMFATIAIDAKNHGVFLEPVPKDTKTPVGGAAASTEANKGVETLTPDEAAAAKADAQIAEIDPAPTPEKAETAQRGALLAGIHSAVDLLNKEGHKPITPGGLNKFIESQFKASGKTQLGTLTVDELERLTMLLSSKIDVLREKKAKAKTTDDI